MEHDLPAHRRRRSAGWWIDRTSVPITVTSTTTGTAISSFESPAIPPDHWLWLEVTAAAGNPQSLTAVVAIALQ